MSANEPPGYEVRLRSRRVQGELDGLRESDRRRVIAGIKALEHDARPPGFEKLYDHIYRVRVANFRIIYLVDAEHKRVDVGGIRRRSETTYKRVDNPFPYVAPPPSPSLCPPSRRAAIILLLAF